MGLALVKRLVEMHGGSVSAKSAGPGRGARFAIRLPVVAAAPSIIPEAVGPAAKPDLHMLLVDDNHDAREMLATLLALKGYRVTQAADGLSAVQAALQARPDIALIDIGLPDIDGHEVARRLRLSKHGRELILIALTGFGQFQDQQLARGAGFDLHLIKPVEADALESALAQLRAVKSDKAKVVNLAAGPVDGP